MSKPVFVYTIYIASTPEKVFKALTDTDVTQNSGLVMLSPPIGRPARRSNFAARAS
jgi:hypothetical protein